MWTTFSETLDRFDTYHKNLYNELSDEIVNAAPSAQLSMSMRSRLCKINTKIRKKLVDLSSNGGTPLFKACRRGLTETVEFLCTVCEADVEIKGLYEVPDEHSVHFVSPLWCASVAGKLEVVKVLLRHGADIDSVSDTGSTSVRSACFMSHYNIVKYLVEQGANIHKTNFHGGTCLINSVQSVKLCKYLIEKGSDVNAQDVKMMTALHYAIEEHRVETVKLLLDKGADPHLENKLGDDALRLSCIKGNMTIFNLLLDVVDYKKSQIADGYELIGSTFLDDNQDPHNLPETTDLWRLALQIRLDNNIPKEVMPPIKAFDYRQEFTTIEELEAISNNLDLVTTQSLLICQRVLGPYHKDSIFRLMFRGAVFADVLQYRKSISLWLHALELKAEKDTIMFVEVAFTAQAVAKLFMDVCERFSKEKIKEFILFDDAFSALLIIGNQIKTCMNLLSLKPAHRRHQTNFDQMLWILLHYLYICLLVCEEESADFDRLHSYMENIIKLHPLTTQRKLTFLHLALMKNLTDVTFSLPGNPTEARINSPFPNAGLIKFLLSCGAPVNAVSDDFTPPLHFAISFCESNLEVIKLLLKHGAHADQANKDCVSHEKWIKRNFQDDPEMLETTFPLLKCLAARTLADIVRNCKTQLQCSELPRELLAFINIH